MTDIQRAIRMVIETGKADFGARGARAHALRGTAKTIIIAANCPKDLKDEILNNCGKSGVPCREVAFSSLELGSVCGKPFPVSALSVIDAGASDILTAPSESSEVAEAGPGPKPAAEKAGRKAKEAKETPAETEAGTESEAKATAKAE